jgi:hypothetical protein
MYDYRVLTAKALSSDATQEDINALGEWFEAYGYQYWNGECYEVDTSHYLYPVLSEEPDEYGGLEVTGYELR